MKEKYIQLKILVNILLDAINVYQALVQGYNLLKNNKSVIIKALQILLFLNF